eukprot:CAMPEP_0169125822 /NCGR_PEP_ID=MMETSP1015-20121227/35102_1 /TAXON_ID=342587 /ORGANISM="Karlodinium micrum, Strain CCMP2283" /LENGTH=313 /DNA_ID=CAMNT_0009189409 /DNA_START=68 /DNA_END=1009 /DNA_ORIENTATION=+
MTGYSHGGHEAHHVPTGYQPHGDGQIFPQGHGSQLMRRDENSGYGLGPQNSSMAAVAQLFARLSQEIEEKKPANCVHFIVGFLCQHYPEHLHGFASIWQMDPDLERERHEVVNFFKSHKISTAVAAHFTNAGYDTLDTLTTLSPDNLVDVEAFNNVKWLPGHKVRLQQIFSEIAARVRAYRQAHPNQTRQIVGQPTAQYSRPPSPTTIRPAIGNGTATTAPGAPREYVVGVSAPVRVGGPQATTYSPDVLQQPRGAPLALPAPMPGVYPQAAPPVAVGTALGQHGHAQHGAHGHAQHGAKPSGGFGFHIPNIF